MPITLLDIILIVVMLISALLAMVRGFMREVLSITAWILAAGATLYSYGKLLPLAKTYFNNDIVAAAVVVGGVFLLTLLIVSVITVRISDMVLDSRVGALDPHAWLLVRARPRADHRGHRLYVFRLAGSRSQQTGLGFACEIESGAQHGRRLDKAAVAGRPREHHFKEAETAEARGWR